MPENQKLHSHVPPLNSLFEDWVDFDIAAYYLACVIGIVDYDASFDEFRRTKALYWTDNKVGNLLYDMIGNMADAELLEKDEERGYRWNKLFNVD